MEGPEDPRSWSEFDGCDTYDSTDVLGEEIDHRIGRKSKDIERSIKSHFFRYDHSMQMGRYCLSL